MRRRRGCARPSLFCLFRHEQVGGECEKCQCVLTGQELKVRLRKIWRSSRDAIGCLPSSSTTSSFSPPFAAHLHIGTARAHLIHSPGNLLDLNKPHSPSSFARPFASCDREERCCTAQPSCIHVRRQRPSQSITLAHAQSKEMSCSEPNMLRQHRCEHIDVPPQHERWPWR